MRHILFLGLAAFAVAGCAASQEDLFLECLQEAKVKEAAILCERVLLPDPDEESFLTEEELFAPPELDMASLEMKWVQPYLGEQPATQSCLRVFDTYWRLESGELSELTDDEFFSLGPLYEGPSAVETACYVNGKVLADCYYCNEFRARDEEKRAEIERLRLLGSRQANETQENSQLR